MTTATIGDVLMQDIIAQPQDDGLRLIFADFCEDNDQPERAEFIRVQLELAKYPPARADGLTGWSSAEAAQSAVDEDDPRRERLQRREQELWRSRREGAWTIPSPLMSPAHYCLPSDVMAKASAPQIPVLVFRRGFASEVRSTLVDWMEYGPILARTAPLERVVLTDRKAHKFTSDMDIFGLHMWQWYEDDDLTLQHRLPKEWMEMLIACHSGRQHKTASTINTYYSTEEEANKALSDVCLILARKP